MQLYRKVLETEFKGKLNFHDNIPAWQEASQRLYRLAHIKKTDFCKLRLQVSIQLMIINMNVSKTKTMKK